MIYSSVKKNSICLVIVLYNELLYDTKTYKSLISEYNIDGYSIGLFIWDNSSRPLHNPSEFKNGICYKYTGKNEGVSKAYNEAAIYSQANNYEWVLLLDQDTIFPPLILEEYQRVINENRVVKLFTLKTKIANGKYMSPAIYRHKISHLSNKAPPTGLLKLSNYSMINSGLLINIEAFWKVGGYNEKIWLDFSDHEFIERFKSVYKECYVLDKESTQSFSITETNIELIKERYRIFCQCIRKCPRYTLFDDVEYFFLVSKRLFSLIIKTKRVSFIKHFFEYYLF